MTIARKTQIGLILTALVLFVLLFLAPKKNTGKSENFDHQDTVKVSQF